MNNERIVLNTGLIGSSRHTDANDKYRAVLIRKEAGEYAPEGNGDVIHIEQFFNGKWRPTSGTWYAETLLGRDRINDAICIDGGADWNIHSGMRKALNVYLSVSNSRSAWACAHRLRNHTLQVEGETGK